MKDKVPAVFDLFCSDSDSDSDSDYGRARTLVPRYPMMGNVCFCLIMMVRSGGRRPTFCSYLPVTMNECFNNIMENYYILS